MKKKYALIGGNAELKTLEKIHLGNFVIDGRDATYETIVLNEDEFDAKIGGILAEYDGLEIAAPYKERIIPFLSKLDESAKKYNAVNVVRRCCHGDTTGYNAEVMAFLDMYGADLVGMRILVVGAGGAGRPIAQALEKEVFDTDVVNIDRVGEEKIVEAMTAGELDVVVNATPVELPFAAPAWVTMIDMRPDHGGEKLMLASAKASEAIWFENKHEGGCGCHGHDECGCGHHHEGGCHD